MFYYLITGGELINSVFKFVACFSELPIEVYEAALMTFMKSYDWFRDGEFPAESGEEFFINLGEEVTEGEVEFFIKEFTIAVFIGDLRD